jgi:hypothetical protein
LCMTHGLSMPPPLIWSPKNDFFVMQVMIPVFNFFGLPVNSLPFEPKYSF